MEDIEKTAQGKGGSIFCDEGAAHFYGGEGEMSLWCMDRRVCVDSREACRSDPGCYDFFPRDRFVTELDRGVRVRVRSRRTREHVGVMRV